jgi:hypothetical protein
LFRLIGVLVVLSLIVAGGVWRAWPKKIAITLDVSGTPGLPIMGTADVDGSTQALTATVPAKFNLEGCRVAYSLTTAEDSGEFRVKAVIGDSAIGSSGSGNPPKNGVRGWIRSSWGTSPPTFWIENFSKDEDKGWLTPPP